LGNTFQISFPSRSTSPTNTRNYIYGQTSSPRLDKVLRKWEEDRRADAAQRQKLALVELPTYQFASPVRRIENQDLLFASLAFERLIELGPSPTLTGMDIRTMKAKYKARDDSTGRSWSILCHAEHGKEIYYQFEDEPEAAEATEQTSQVPSPTPISALIVQVSTPTPSVAAASVEDVPIKAIEILSVVVAQKLEKKVDEVPLSKTIKDLVGGKSALQNEILGDL
jgi:fatty acid synthase subunit alpha